MPDAIRNHLFVRISIRQAIRRGSGLGSPREGTVPAVTLRKLVAVLRVIDAIGIAPARIQSDAVGR